MYCCEEQTVYEVGVYPTVLLSPNAVELRSHRQETRLHALERREANDVDRCYCLAEVDVDRYLKACDETVLDLVVVQLVEVVQEENQEDQLCVRHDEVLQLLRDLDGVSHEQRANHGEVFDLHVADACLACALTDELEGDVRLVHHQAVFRSESEAHHSSLPASVLGGGGVSRLEGRSNHRAYRLNELDEKRLLRGGEVVADETRAGETEEGEVGFQIVIREDHLEDGTVDDERHFLKSVHALVRLNC